MVVFIGISKFFNSLCFFFFSALLVLLPAIEAFACTTFFLKQDGHQVFGRNYDWNVEEALIIANKRGMFKRSYVRAEATGEAAAWRSKYGSVTFNQYGREFPTGGKNEAGLVVETMSLSEADDAHHRCHPPGFWLPDTGSGYRYQRSAGGRYYRSF